MADQPTLIFVPGSWHTPECYSKITKILEEEYCFQCNSITLPSTNGDPNSTFKDDIEVARAAISSETTQGRNVIVVAHSYGGMIGNSAIKGFTRPRSTFADHPGDASTPAMGYVIGLVLIASGFALTGLSFMDPLFGIPPPTWRVNKETGFAEIVTPPRELFYHDVPEEEADYWVSKLTTHSLKSLFEGGEHAYAGWKDVPVWYIGTTEDRGLPVVIQRMQVGMAREMGGVVEHRELQTSHSPFLSQPEKVVEILNDAVRAFTGEVPEAKQEDNARKSNISIPGAKILQPYTWFKFGLPLLFGHILGRGFVIFSWVRTIFGSRSA